MNLVWAHDNIRIGSISTNRWEDSQLWTSGFGWYHFDADTQHENPVVFQWEATALSYGWYIVITKAGGRVGEVQGSTFNLPLEIASAARRLL